MNERDDHDGWTDLIAVTDLETNDATRVIRDGVAYAVYDTPDGICVTSATCTHAGANLCDGYFDGTIIECPLHQGYFDIRTGAALGAPATQPLKTFASRVVGGNVQVMLESSKPG